MCFSSHFSHIWFAPSIFAPSHKTKSADILFCKDTNLIKFEPKSLFPDCPISVSFMCGHARFSPQGSPASLLPRLLPPRGLQSWTQESHHFYTIHCKVYSYTLSMSVYTHLIYTTIQHTLHLLSMLYKSTTLGDFRAGLSRATISIQYTTKYIVIR